MTKIFEIFIKIFQKFLLSKTLGWVSLPLESKCGNVPDTSGTSSYNTYLLL